MNMPACLTVISGSKLFCLVTGICFSQSRFQQQAGIPAQIFGMTFEVAYKQRNQRSPVCVLWHAQVAKNIVDRLVPMVKSMPQLGGMMAGSKSFNEAGANSALEVTHRIIICNFAVLEHFCAGEIAF